ncbi:hypothetical protein ES703_19054 [subsurface metagenome]
MEKLLTIEEVAKHFRVKPKTIYEWMKRGILRSSRVGGVRRFKREDVEALFVSGSPTSEDYKGK